MSKRSKKKKRRMIPVPIASMGDIAFLLIIFFMVCSEVTKDNSKLELESPESKHAEKPDKDIVAYVAMDENGDIYFDGDKFADAEMVETAISSLLTKTVSDEQRHVQFKCDKSLTKEQFEPVLKAIAAGGGIIEAVGERND